jgi:hypothetical protein
MPGKAVFLKNFKNKKKYTYVPFEEYTRYIDLKIKQGLGLGAPTPVLNRTYGEPLMSRIVPLLIYREKLEKTFNEYRKRHIPRSSRKE